ncbi:MAG: hypothetical protein V3R93_06305 [Candidatus Hydrothermarchaeaceae archaeon]
MNKEHEITRVDNIGVKQKIYKKRCEVVGTDLSETVIRIAKGKDSERAHVVEGVESIIFKRNHSQEERAWLIDRAIERKDIDLIYDNGEAYVMVRQK